MHRFSAEYAGVALQLFSLEMKSHLLCLINGASWIEQSSQMHLLKKRISKALNKIAVALNQWIDYQLTGADNGTGSTRKLEGCIYLEFYTKRYTELVAIQNCHM